jgi:hypothetical protein
MIDSADVAEWIVEDLKSAVHGIDLLLGDGYAKQHPELIAGWLQAAAIWQARDVMLEIREILENFELPKERE